MLFGTSVYCPLRRDLRCLMRETWFVGGQNENDPTAVSHGEAHALNDPNVSEAATSYQGSLVHHPRLGCPSSACFDCGALRAFAPPCGLLSGLACGITLGVHDQKKPASLAPELSWVWMISRRQDHTAHGDGGQSAKASRATLGYMDRVGAM